MRAVSQSQFDTIQAAVDSQRIIETALALIEVPSPTRSAAAVADRLAAILSAMDFTVQRPEANWKEAPAVVARYDTGIPGPVLQFDGHLDTVHLPFIPAQYRDGNLYGSGSADMKGGIAAFVEALRVLRDVNALPAGSILLTAHDHHEGPWGDRRQLRALIEQGYVGDAVLLPEYLADRLPLAGRGLTIFEITIRRTGEPVHEVLRDPGLPDVIGTGAELLRRLHLMGERIQTISAPYAGHDSVFVGSIHAGEIFNQAPVECNINGTRRWVTPGKALEVQGELRQILAGLAEETGTQIDVDFDLPGDAFAIQADHTLVAAFQSAHASVTGQPLPVGNKPFVDDGNVFAAAGVAALTHGPAATGAHTLNECVAVSELVRVAKIYALTAIAFCSRP